MPTGFILGIESSCDETAAAVVQNGTAILSNTIASQVDLHALYGGVVPELASREHLRAIVPVVRQAIQQAGITLQDLDAIAVTEGPGLAGALLVGIVYSKALAFGLGKPLIAINHLEGHIHAVLMDAGRAFTRYPILALVVSGGHTHLYLANQNNGVWTYRNVGRTLDDAAGEAFDKVAKLLGLGYPGGPWIDALAPQGDPTAVPFRFAELHQSTPEKRFDFSFSGIKTAVLRYTQTHTMAESIARRREAKTITQAQAASDPQTLNLIASFQCAVVGNLMRQTFAAARHFGAQAIIISGGVAANRELRRRFTAEAARRALPIAFPALSLATDNAAMIAAAAWPRYLAGDYAEEAMTAIPQLKLG